MQTLNEKLKFLLDEVERLSKKVEALESKKPASIDLTPITNRVLNLENKKPEIKETIITKHVEPEKLDIKSEIIDTIKSTVDLKYINNIYRNK